MIVTRVNAYLLTSNLFQNIIYINFKVPNIHIHKGTRFRDTSVSEWKIQESAEKCWKMCEKSEDCKAITFYNPTSKCQFFNNSLPLTITKESKFTSYTTVKGITINILRKLKNKEIFYFKELPLKLNSTQLTSEKLEEIITFDIDDCWKVCFEKGCSALSFLQEQEPMTDQNCFLSYEEDHKLQYSKDYITIITVPSGKYIKGII